LEEIEHDAVLLSFAPEKGKRGLKTGSDTMLALGQDDDAVT
jgi:hypothetical protein